MLLVWLLCGLNASRHGRWNLINFVSVSALQGLSLILALLLEIIIILYYMYLATQSYFCNNLK